MEKDKSSLYTFCSLPQEQISLTQMNPLYLYQSSPLGWMGGSMHVLGLAELLRLLPLHCCCCLFCVWLEREEIVGRGIRHVAPTCQPRSLFFLSPSPMRCVAGLAFGWSYPVQPRQNMPRTPVATKPTHTHHYSS